ncbi:MAG: gamma-glutamylcyclotransferase family protein [Pseudomonadota bacterium]
MQDPHFFGYGSLVNRQTHAYPDARRARLAGWRRIWQPTRLRGLRFLSVHAVENGQIEGLIARVPGADWAALDLREQAYLRQPVEVDLADGGAAVGVEVYQTDPVHLVPGDASQPVLLSYLDTVVQGFLAEFGPDGVSRFFATTDGWPAHVLDDRTAPIYPRAKELTDGEIALVDGHLEALRCVKKDASQLAR